MQQKIRMFKSGNSQAIRIPAELAFERQDIELEIERIGDELRIRPARRRLGDVVMSAITYEELCYGVQAACNPEKERLALKSLIEDIPVLAFDETACLAYGPLRFATRDSKKDHLDKLIACHAIVLGITLVSNNVKDFKRYPGLLVENWLN